MIDSILSTILLYLPVEKAYYIYLAGRKNNRAFTYSLALKKYVLADKSIKELINIGETEYAVEKVLFDKKFLGLNVVWPYISKEKRKEIKDIYKSKIHTAGQELNDSFIKTAMTEINEFPNTKMSIQRQRFRMILNSLLAGQIKSVILMIESCPPLHYGYVYEILKISDNINIWRLFDGQLNVPIYKLFKNGYMIKYQCTNRKDILSFVAEEIKKSKKSDYLSLGKYIKV